MTISIRKIAIQTFVGIMLSGLVIAIYLGNRQMSGNLHEVVPGEFYRSAQPSLADLAFYARQHGIKSVLNLRGANVGSPWYDREVATTEALGMQHLDFRMKAKRELTTAESEELIRIMRDAPKPLLVHCQAGADRTGLAAALYVSTIKGGSTADGASQLSLLFGHLPFHFSKAWPMDQSYEQIRATETPGGKL